VLLAEHSHKARETSIVNQRDDQRAQELSNLKLALATFALRLDTFEARMKVRPTKTNAEPTKLSSPDIGVAKHFPNQ
jgi:hypothetical protein